MKSILTFLVDYAEDKHKLNEPFLAKILMDVGKTAPMSLINIGRATEIIQKGNVNDQDYSTSVKLIDAILPEIVEWHSNIATILIEKGHEVAVNTKGEMVIDIDGEECRV